MKSIYGVKNDNFQILMLLVLFSSSITICFQTFIITEDLYYEFYGSQLSYDRISRLLDFQEKWNWLTYIFIPIIYLLKFLLLSMWVLSGSILLNKKISFKQIFKVVLIAEFIWLIPSIFALIWFGLIDTDYSLIDIQNFQPLSLLSIFNGNDIEPWLVFPLKSINLFEVGYVVVLALALKKITETDLNEALNFTVPVYGSALITWIVFVTFLSINLSA